MKRRPGHTKTKSSMKRMHGNAVQAKNIVVQVTRDDIESAECGKPTKCMIKVALKRALNLSHGYIHVDATGVSISRNGSYREKAFLPRPAMVNMVKFDAEANLPRAARTVKPFKFQLQFFKTTKVNKYTPAQMAVKIKRKVENGNSKKRYDIRSRVIGLALAGGSQIAA
jgi:hypothetical protein